MGVNAVVFVVFLVSRPALTDDGWALLERQRPIWHHDGLDFTVVADGLNFAIARRPMGGWGESRLISVFAMINAGPFLAAGITFEALQFSTFTTSKFNSDVGTLVFFTAVLAQWLGLALLLSLRRPSAAA